MPAVRSHFDVVETLDSLLMRRGAERPDDIFLRFADGEVSFAETDGRVSAVARGLARLGIGRAELVPVLLPNSAEFVVTWLALCRLGAVAMLVNTALRGPALRHALEMTSARQMVVHSSLTPSLQPVVPELSTLRTAVMVGDHVEAGVHLPRLRRRPVLRCRDRRGRRARDGGPFRHRPGDGAVHVGHDRSVQGLRPVPSVRGAPSATHDRALRAAGRRRLVQPVPAVSPRRLGAHGGAGARARHDGGHR